MFRQEQNVNNTLNVSESCSLIAVSEFDEFSDMKKPKTQTQKLSKLVWRNDVFNKTILRTMKKSFTSKFLECTGLLKKVGRADSSFLTIPSILSDSLTNNFSNRSKTRKREGNTHTTPLSSMC